MSEMVDRVAKGMCRAAITKPALFMYSPEGVEYHVNQRWPEYVDLARAAIEAMREPTSTMVAAAVNNGDYGDPEDFHPAITTIGYQAMIDEALKP